MPSHSVTFNGTSTDANNSAKAGHKEAQEEAIKSAIENYSPVFG